VCLGEQELAEWVGVVSGYSLYIVCAFKFALNNQS